MLLAIDIALENTIFAWRQKAETKAKITGFLKHLKDYQTLSNSFAYLDVLEKIRQWH